MVSRATLAAVGRSLLVAELALVVFVLVGFFVWAAFIYPVSAAVVCGLLVGLAAFEQWFRSSGNALTADDLDD